MAGSIRLIIPAGLYQIVLASSAADTAPANALPTALPLWVTIPKPPAAAGVDAPMNSASAPARALKACVDVTMASSLAFYSRARAATAERCRVARAERQALRFNRSRQAAFPDAAPL
jgi:hypothetical protein